MPLSSHYPSLAEDTAAPEYHLHFQSSITCRLSMSERTLLLLISGVPRCIQLDSPPSSSSLSSGPGLLILSVSFGLPILRGGAVFRFLVGLFSSSSSSSSTSLLVASLSLSFLTRLTGVCVAAKVVSKFFAISRILLMRCEIALAVHSRAASFSPKKEVQDG
jgi:hypothetical protein